MIAGLERKFGKNNSEHLQQFLLLYQVGNMFKNYDSRKDFNLNYPNRHGVLHGRQLDFGTKVNCMKVVSFAGKLLESIKQSRDRS